MTDDADDRESAEARALAQALAGGDGDPDAPSDALETAGLLRYGAGGAELSEARSEALLAALLPHVHERPASSFARLPLRPWVRAGAPLAIAAVVLLAVLRAIDGPSTSPSKPERDIAVSSGLPEPPRSLLAAQAALARDKDERKPEVFDLEMRRYREQVLRALAREYPARIGCLEPRGRR